MEFGFSRKEIDFRDEVEDFLKSELPADWPVKSRHWPGGYGTIEMQNQEMMDTAQQFRQKLAQKGWFTIAWPEEYGGKAHSYMEQAIFDERMSYYRAPSVGIATGIAGPTILRFGTEENKQDWIRRIANAEIEMWLAYSEPDAGSDLASIQTTALLEGDEYVINGQKVWSTVAHLADYAWLIARTDPDGHRHHSVSLFVVDNQSPGVTIKPLINIVGVHSFNEVFFDNVRVPLDHVLLGEGRGFEIAQGRLGPGRIHHCMRLIGCAQRALELMCVRAESRSTFGRPLSKHQSVREDIARSFCDIEQARLLTLKAAARMDLVGNKVARDYIAAIKIAVCQ